MSVKVTALISASFTGITTNGAVSVPGLKVGDILLANTANGNVYLVGWFEPVVTVDDEIQQTQDADLSTLILQAVLFRSA